MKGFGNIFAQLKELTERFKEFQNNLENIVIEASAGGDMVTVKMNGKRELLSIKIKKEVVNPDDIEMLEDLILAAISEAQRKVKEAISEQMGQMGFKLPGVPDFSDFI